MPRKKAETTDGEEGTEETTETTTTQESNTDTGKGSSTTERTTSRESTHEEREPSWVANLTGALKGIADTQREIAEMVKPRETPDGAGVKVKGANSDGTEHQIVTTQEQAKRPTLPTGHRKLSLFRFRK